MLRQIQPKVVSYEPRSDESVLLSLKIILILCVKLIQLLVVLVHSTQQKLLLSLELLLHEFLVRQLQVLIPHLLQTYGLGCVKNLLLNSWHHLWN